MIRKIAGIVVFCALLVLALYQAFIGFGGSSIKIGKPAADFSLADLSGQPVSLSSFHGRKLVLLDFWATWCGPCQMAMPELQRLHDEFKYRGLEVIGINEGEAAGDVRSFAQHNRYTFRLALDASQSVGRQYRVRGIPTTLLVDKEGVVRWGRIGFSPDIRELHQLIEQLADKEASVPEEEPAAVPAPRSNRPIVSSPPPAPVPAAAARYGVKLGDTVKLSAIKPAIALQRAVITAMDDEKVDVRSGTDTYTIRWKDLAAMSPSGKK